LTCNKLSHCLFDFDCTDFEIYEKEQYNYQEFTFKPNTARHIGMVHDSHQPRYRSSLDTYVLRDAVKITTRAADAVNLNYYQNHDKFVLRFIFKNKEGKLWCFNRPTVEP